jgi:hypothetical protein
MENINKQLQTVIGNLIGKDYLKLEFGCKVIKSYFTEVNYEVLGYEDKEDVILWQETYYDTGKGYKTSLPDGIQNVRLLKHNGNIFICDKEKFSILKELGIQNPTFIKEIIGQEPTLNDLLLAIEKTGVGIYVITTQGHICELTSSRPEDILFKIDLEKSIFNQSDETKLAIIKLLE